MKQRLVVPVIRGVVGNWVFYSSMMRPRQVADWIRPAKDIREAEQLDEILQRDLDKRAKGIAKYLLTRESRFFNAIIVGVFGGIPEWVPFDLDEKARELGATSDESFAQVAGFLVFDGDEDMFAIDGQHRVAGIAQALQECPSATALHDDQFPVVFLAHVDNAAGRKRTRRLFSDINKNAKPVARGDRVLIDEDDQFAIVARKLYAEYEHFESGNQISLTKNTNLDADDYRHFTNLLSLHSVAKTSRSNVRKTRGTSWLDSENIQKLYDESKAFLDFAILNVVVYRQYFREKTLSLQEVRKRNRNLLFRPVGLVLLCRIYSHMRRRGRLKVLEDRLADLSFECPGGLFERVLWNRGRLEVVGKNQKLALELALHILGEPVDQEALLELYREVTKNESASLPVRPRRKQRRRRP